MKLNKEIEDNTKCCCRKRLYKAKGNIWVLIIKIVVYKIN